MYAFHANLKQLGLTDEEIQQFAVRMEKEYGEASVNDVHAFLFECIRFLGEKITVLKDEINCMKQVKGS